MTHRLLHTRYLYGRVHKQHHEYNVTIALATEYAHPVEYFLGNVLPSAVGSILLGSRIHYYQFLCQIFIRTFRSHEGHSGYAFPWSQGNFEFPFDTSKFHDFHHSHNVGNYGASCIWDYLLGTDKAFKKYMKEKEEKEKQALKAGKKD